MTGFGVILMFVLAGLNCGDAGQHMEGCNGTECQFKMQLCELYVQKRESGYQSVS